MDDSIGTETHPPASVKRVRRKKKQDIKLTSRLTQTPGGTIYYRMTELPTSSDGRVKYRSVKLSSKSLAKAEKEVIRRRLNKFEEFSVGKSTESLNAEPKAA